LDFWKPAPILVAGPCLIDDHAVNVEIAGRVAETASKYGVRAIFKASFDKANRSNSDATRGPGIEKGLELLRAVKVETNMKLLTDVHDAGHIESVAEVVDVLQVPAFLCRQTDLLSAAGSVGLPVNIKKGQWMAPEAMLGAVLKVRNSGCLDVAVTERGTFFGYGDLVVDMRSFRRIREETGAAVLYDATHSLQRPGMGAGRTTGGNREFCLDLVLAAAGAGTDGFFVETHPEPQMAVSDSETMLPLAELDDLIAAATNTWRSAQRPQCQ